MIVEVLHNANLLRQVRGVVAQYVRASEHGGLDIDYERICNDPLLQSVYAETFRLRDASFLFRASDHKEFDLNGWRIPRDAPILVSGHDAQMDSDVWTPKDKPHFGQPMSSSRRDSWEHRVHNQRGRLQNFRSKVLGIPGFLMGVVTGCALAGILQSKR